MALGRRPMVGTVESREAPLREVPKHALWLTRRLPTPHTFAFAAEGCRTLSFVDTTCCRRRLSWSPGPLVSAILAARPTPQLVSTVQWPERSSLCRSRLANTPAAGARHCAPHASERWCRVYRAPRLRSAVPGQGVKHCEAAVEHESVAVWPLMVVCFSSCARVPCQGCALLT